MSLICFRGHPILPPLVNTESKNLIESQLQKNYSSITTEDQNIHGCCCKSCNIDETTRKGEDDTLLSLPPCKALAIVLPGLHVNSSTKPDSQLPAKRSFNFRGQKAFDVYNINRLSSDKKRNENTKHNYDVSSSKLSNSDMLLKKKPDSTSPELPRCSNGNMCIEENSASEVTTGTFSLSCTSSPFSEDDARPDVQFELELDHCTDNDSRSLTRTEELSGVSQYCLSVDPTKTYCVSSNQKIKALKSSGKDSSTYLEDYLQLLTSRVPPPCRQMTNSQDFKSEDKSSSGISVESATGATSKSEIKKNKNRNEIKPRGLGSHYLDSYLVNLTDYSWIIYPTESKSLSQPSKAVTFDLAADSIGDCNKKQIMESAADNEGCNKKQIMESATDNEGFNYLRRKLHFIDPDKFFNRHGDNTSKSNVCSLPCQSNLKIEKECDNSNISHDVDPATSPDVSSSIFDLEIDKSCNSSMPNTSTCALNGDFSINRNLNESDHSTESNEMMRHWETKPQIAFGYSSISGSVSKPLNEITNSMSVERDKVNIVHSVVKENNSSLALNFEKDKADCTASRTSSVVQYKPRILTGLFMGERVQCENKIDEETSSSSEVSTVTEPSTIVLVSDQHSLAHSDFEQSFSSDLEKSNQESKILSKTTEILLHTVEKQHNRSVQNSISNQHDSTEDEGFNTLNQLENISTYDRPNSSISELTQDDSLIESSEKIGSVGINEQKLSFLIELLKAKQNEEMNELKNKHELELHNFLSQLKQLPEDQVSLLANAYNSPNNNSLNELFDFPNISSQTNLVSSIKDKLNTIDIEKNSSSNSGEIDSSPSSFQMSNHTNSVPSFFLHENRKENGSANETENSQISQIFSHSRTRFEHVPQTITDLLSQHPNLGSSTNQCSGVSCVPEIEPKSSTSDLLEAKIQSRRVQMEIFSKSTLEAGLDLVPARERDLASVYEKTLSSKHRYAICKLQAVIRGRIIRKLMKTSQVQQLFSTLKEVALLAHRFHHDILTDNIRKGDVDFHKALFNEEQQTRDKLNHIMVELCPAEQIKIIQKDQIAKEKEAHRKALSCSKIALPASSTSRSLISKIGSDTQPTQHSSSKSSMIPNQRTKMTKRAGALVISEATRPCQSNLSLENSTRKQSLSPKDRRASSIPAPKPIDTQKCIPKIRTCTIKRSDIAKSSSTMSKSVNSHLCKSESILHNYGAAKINGNHQSPLRRDVFHARKPWR